MWWCFFTSVSTLDSYKEEIWTYKKRKQGKIRRDVVIFLALREWACSQAKVCSSTGRLPFHISQLCILLILTFYLPNNYTIALFFCFLMKWSPVTAESHACSQISPAYAAVNENIIQIIINGLHTMLGRDDYHRVSTGRHPSAHSDIPASSVPPASRHSSGFWLQTRNINYGHFLLQPEVDRRVFRIHRLNTAKWALRLTTNHMETEFLTTIPMDHHYCRKSTLRLYVRMDYQLSPSAHMKAWRLNSWQTGTLLSLCCCQCRGTNADLLSRRSLYISSGTPAHRRN